MSDRPDKENTEAVEDLQPNADESADVKGGKAASGLRRPPGLPRDDSWD